MKLLYIHQYFKTPKDKSGARSYDLSKRFVENGIEVEVISSTNDETLKSKKKWVMKSIDNIKIHYIYLPYKNEMNSIQRIIVFFKFIWYATFKSLKIDVDLVLATSTPLTIGIPALIKKWKDKTPYIFEVRDVWPEVVISIGVIKNRVLKKILFFLEELVYQKADAIVPLSIDMKDSIVSRYPGLNAIIEVIPNMSVLERFNIREISRSNYISEKIGFKPRFSVLYAGTFGKVNGIDYVVNLAKKTLELDSSIVYILIGNGQMKENVIEKAKRMGVLNKNVFFLSSVPKSILPYYYNEVDMGSSFVIPIKELWANSANKFFDTLAASKPILINYEGWQKKVIEENNLGYVLPTEINLNEAEKFVRYTLKKQEIDNQSINALNKAKESYSREIAVNKYCLVFNKILKIK